MTTEKNNQQEAAENAAAGGYGYFYEESRNYGKFGLNERVRLVSFKYLEATGKDLTGGEAVQVAFLMEGEDEPNEYLAYPVTKVTYEDKKTGERIDLNSLAECKNDDQRKAWQADVNKFNHFITSLLGAFKTQEQIRAALSRPFTSFKSFVEYCSTLLPKDYDKIYFDLFLQYRWQATQKKDSEGNLTGDETVFLEVPRKNSRQGLWIVPHVEPVGQWTMHTLDKETTEDSVQKALWFEDEAGNTHPFRRTGYFIKSLWAKNIKERNGQMEGGNALQAAAGNAGDQPTTSGSETW